MHLWAPRFLCCDAKHVFSWIPSLCVYSRLKAPKLLYSILLLPRLLCLLPNCYLRMWIALCPKTVCCDTTLQDLLSWPSMDVDGSRLDSFATLSLMPSGWPHPLDISPHAKTVFTVSSFSVLRILEHIRFSYSMMFHPDFNYMVCLNFLVEPDNLRPLLLPPFQAIWKVFKRMK